MSQQKRPFYIIGHNPNTIAEAKGFLEEGANALEPDIVHSEGQYYICHEPRPSYGSVPTLEEYLRELKALIISANHNVALIIWDLKSKDFDPNDFISRVKQNFAGGPCDGIAMLMTHSDDDGFVRRYNEVYDNVGVGVDEPADSPDDLANRFISGHKRFSYANGITTILHKPGIFKSVWDALQHRAVHEPNSFGLIYTWVLGRVASMRRYLNAYIDGIFVDVHSVKRLRELIANLPYSEFYQLAQNGHNPFDAPPIPRYLLTVKTKDKMFAGTDTQFEFTVSGASGTLSSLPFNANVPGVFERGSTTLVTMEGMDVGEIKTLTIEAIKGGIGAGWLPEKITVGSNLDKRTYEFEFGGRDGEEWVSKGKGPLTKFPAKAAT